VGQSVPRVDARAKVLGKGVFAADLFFPRMLYARVIRSSRPHATLTRIDLDAARKTPGVYAVLTAEDIPGRNEIHVVFNDQPFLAPGRVRYVGEPIAVLAAETPEIAEEAVAKVVVEYEDLPALFDPLKARGHSEIHLFGTNNIYKHLKVRRGNVEEGFARSDIIIENTYRTPYQEHAYLEPQGMVAVPRPNGLMEVYGSMQCPFYVQEGVATVLGLPLSQVRVIQTATGGAFGGKEDVPTLVGVQAAILAQKTGRPVKLIYSRDEDIISMSKRHPGIIRYKSGAKKDGTLQAIEVEYILDSGAYATLSPVVLWRGTVHAGGPYRIPNVKVDSYAVATNKVPAGAFRGFGSPQILFAAESQMDELARALGLDPAEIREKNLLRLNDETITGQKLSFSVGNIEAFHKALDKSNYFEKKKQPKDTRSPIRKGIGLSTVYYGVGLGAGGVHLARTGAYVQILADSSVQFAVGTTEMGQGMATVLTQIVADELGLPVESVYILETDTSRIPDSGPTVASRATTMSGNALKDACAQLRKPLKQAAADLLGLAPDSIRLKDGWAFDAAHSEKRIPMRDVIAECFRRRENMAAAGFFRSPEVSWDDETGQGNAYVTFAYATNVAEVEVDTETGAVRVVRITAAHDVGKAINPQLVTGQIEGGTVQGMGYALTEEIVTKDGVIQNPHFSTYIIPTIKEAPEIDPIIVEAPYPNGPNGAKGFAEQPLMGIAPAIANAVADAVGIRINELPLKPERVWRALRENETKTAL